MPRDAIIEAVKRIFTSSCIVLSTATVSGAGAVASYENEIRPLFKERCYACHGALKQKGGLRVDTVAFLKEANALVAGDPNASELVARIRSGDDDERMPPEGHALSPDQVNVIVEWIAAGAPAPDGERPEDDPLEHWAFQKIKRPDVPVAEGVSHPVDAFLAAKQAELGLTPVGAADRGLAIRRLYLDLIGLPPTVGQLDDSRPWGEIVDELLASPQHGERWARHWMDVWRYSDWYGLGAQLRYSQKHLWHWRDWIVESLNDDLGYDEMVLAMLAGDELHPGDPEKVRATGFLARNYFLFNRTTWLDSTIEHTGKAFLGLTINCAKCHDHKYDPISLADYYRFRAIFEPHQVRLDPVPGETDLDKNGLPRVFDDNLEAVTWIHQRGDEKQPDKNTKIVPQVPEFLSSFAGPVSEVRLPLDAYAPGSKEWVQDEQLKVAAEKVKQAVAGLASARESADKHTGSPEEAAGDSPSFVAVRDDFYSIDDEVWEVKGKGLEIEDGKLVHSVASREPAELISKQTLPDDFEITCRYTTTGGPTYRSVSFRFHRSGDGRDANYVYTSEHAPGPKVQAAFTRNGKVTYPGDGRKKKQQLTGVPQELRLAVRGDLVNVWHNGEFAFAYRYPEKPGRGKFSLSAFDATAEFDFIEIRALPPGFELTEASNKVEDVPGKSESELKLARLKVEAARAELRSVEATIAADSSRFFNPEKAEEKLILSAAQAQIAATLARAEVDLLGSDAGRKKAAGEAKKKAKKQLAKLKEGEVDYEPLRVTRKALETPAHKFEDYPGVFPDKSTGRRTMLAKWIVSRENPLTARVAVNHVWMRHFGEPLVDSVFDFGRQAKEPEHLALLDFLASEFMESGWSFRHLHRLLVTSEAWRRDTSTAKVDSQTREKDPENRFYWRMNPRRMEAQVVRDSLLHMSGELDLTRGGPSVAPDGKSKRRSLYFTHSPEKRSLFLATFDDADLLQCYRRGESVVPQQALALSNSELAFDASEKMASLLEEDGNRELIADLFLTILGRDPSAQETSECETFLSLFSPKENERARSRLVHALLNHNDFVTIR